MRSGILFSILLLSSIVNAQNVIDSGKVLMLEKIHINSVKAIRSMGHLPDLQYGIIYAGKKNEVILVDSIDANKSMNNTRQIMGKIPGLNIVETEMGGFTANGTGTRGLNPNQSIEMNTRQNGYNISADVFGYNESYYIPAMEGVSAIEIVRGAASLQFGPQLGGTINYIIADPSKKGLTVYSSETMGSYGLYNIFNSIGYIKNKLSINGFFQYRSFDGWRENSSQKQSSGFLRLKYNWNKKLSTSLEYSLLRNRIRMPGGLSDSLFNLDPKISLRSRNWLTSPWNIVALKTDYRFSENSMLYLTSSFLFSGRDLVWRNEEGGPDALDEKDNNTGMYVNREVEKEKMKSSTTEIRMSRQFSIMKIKSVAAGGVRFAYAWFNRMGGGVGSANSDFDLSILGDYAYSLKFTTTNFAPFVENILQISDRFSITPGIRFEYLRSSVNGYTQDSGQHINNNNIKSRLFVMKGIGLCYKINGNSSLFINVSESYKPIDYSQLTSFGLTSKIDQHLKDSKGLNADIGLKGFVKNYFHYDLGLFLLLYKNRIGTVLLHPGMPDQYTLRTNIANSLHSGFESYLEFNILKYLNSDSHNGLSIFNSMSVLNARYQSGAYQGNRVEGAANYISRTGINYHKVKFSCTFQINNNGDAFGDASNVKVSNNPVAGYIPSYTVLDLSGSYKYATIQFKAGINNICDTHYFTRRTDEYPGPGIIPSIGRSFYLSVSRTF